jgi:glucuronoarabinoxylan endo-1,4-beta-xylanase
MAIRSIALVSFLSISAFSLMCGCSGAASGAGGGTGTGTPTNATTTTTLTVSPNPAILGSSIVLSASTSAGTVGPSGTITFLDGSTALGTAALSGGTASLTVTTFAAGSHTLTASYGGATGFSTSTSTAVTLTVNPVSVSTTTTVTAMPSPATAGANVVLTANTSAASGSPTGTVTFFDGSTSLGTAALSSGTASLTVNSLAVGNHTLTASYGGTTGFAASTSNGVALIVSAAVPPITITAHGTFSLATANQTISGFGGAEAFYTNYLDSHPYQAEIYSALFDPTNGLGLTYLRVQNSYYSYTGSNATTFDVDTPQVVKAANAAHGSPLTVLMSSWTPPANIKSNDNIDNGGTLDFINGVSGNYNYSAFAQFWYDSLNAYAALGVTPTYISIQNEPDYTATYVSCRFNPTEATYNGTNYAGYGLAFDAVYKKLQTLSSPPVMIGPEAFSTVNFLDLAAQIPAGEVGAYAHHLYNVNSTSTNPDTGLQALTNLKSAYPSSLKFETEYYASPGFNNAWDIHNALTVANDNAYFYWGLAWPSTLANGQASDQAGVIYIDNPFNAPSSWAFPHGWNYNDSYYALKHYSYFIRPGYVRYNATVDNTDERISVYQSTDKKTTVIVALNVSSTATDGLALDLSTIGYSNSTVYRSTFSTPIATGERWANLGSLSGNGISLPPESVITIVLTN